MKSTTRGTLAAVITGIAAAVGAATPAAAADTLPVPVPLEGAEQSLGVELPEAGAEMPFPAAGVPDAPRYTETTVPTRPADAPRPSAGANSPELLTVKVRYKQPTSDVSEKLEFPFTDGGARFEQASADLRFAAAVAGFGMVLRESPYRGGTTLTDVLAWADGALGQDPGGLRAEFTELVRRARDLRGERGPQPYGAPGTDARRY